MTSLRPSDLHPLEGGGEGERKKKERSSLVGSSSNSILSVTNYVTLFRDRQAADRWCRVRARKIGKPTEIISRMSQRSLFHLHFRITSAVLRHSHVRHSRVHADGIFSHFAFRKRVDLGDFAHHERRRKKSASVILLIYPAICTMTAR